jgi:hydrogenase/urease accessory protein HupE
MRATTNTRVKRRCGPAPRLAIRIASWIAILAVLFAASAAAHPLAPALLELVEAPDGVVDVLWKRSSLSVPGSRIEPVLPPDCPVATETRAEEQGVAVLLRWQIDCSAPGLVGRRVRIDGLRLAKIDTLVRIELADGRTIQRVLRRGEPEMIVPARAERFSVFRDYMTIGFEHILSGADHLLFVFGLFLLCTGIEGSGVEGSSVKGSGVKALVQTVTAFTVGHSITLSLAALGYANLPSGPIEVLIAASVLVLAVELARDASEPTWMRRHPWPMALCFGLLHGMGFAGALREVGLPQGEIPIALFSFNVGIELGQLVFVLGLVALAPLARRLPFRIPQRAAVYGMGSLAAFWFFQRVASL